MYCDLSYNYRDYYKCDSVEGVVLLVKKLFFPYVKESIDYNSGVEYYYKLTEDEFTTQDNFLFTKEDLDLFFSSFEVVAMLSNNPTLSSGIILPKDFGFAEDISIVIISGGIDIYNGGDEWYIVDMGGGRYYKCDQIEGIRKLMVDEGIIKERLNESYQEKYTEVDRIDIMSNGSRVPFSKRESEVMSKYFKFTHSKIAMKYHAKSYGQILNNKKEVMIICYKKLDDWYDVWVNIWEGYGDEYKDFYYRCDQLDGLEDCLKMIKEMIKEINK